MEEKETEGGRKKEADRRGKGAERREQGGGILGPWEKLSKFLQANYSPPKSDLLGLSLGSYSECKCVFKWTIEAAADFLHGPVVKTPYFQCRMWRIPYIAQPKKKKRQQIHFLK